MYRDTHRPVVKFHDGLERTIGSDTFSMTLGGKLLAQRTQIPLDLAWAISVHRSQGMVSYIYKCYKYCVYMIIYVYVKQTVSKAIINMKKVFEYGQAYGKFIFITNR